MKILFITGPEEDYLSDSLFHGFKKIFGGDVVDYPRKDILYKDCPSEAIERVTGRGFTLYTGLLVDDKVYRSHIAQRLQRNEFDLIVIGDIWRQFGFFVQWRPYLHPNNTILLDGCDSQQVYPYAGFWWRRPYFWFLPRICRGFLYFKREWTERSQFNAWHRLLPQSLWTKFPYDKRLRRVSFSIPEEKIVPTLPIKSKDFPRHIVDNEVAQLISGSSTKYAFKDEKEYYSDLQASRYGITTKRSGWDCLRHYEIAANGCVPCFRDLDRKPVNCAPHGLRPGENCLSYTSADNLLDQILTINTAHYHKLQRGALAWARENSSHERAREVFLTWQNYCLTKSEQQQHAFTPLSSHEDGSSNDLGGEV